MPLWNAIVLVGIVAAFAVFGIALAWVDHQTRNLGGGWKRDEPASSNHDRQEFKKAA